MTEQTPFAGPESATDGETGAKGRVGHLEAIIDRLSALTEPSREVDAMIYAAVFDGWEVGGILPGTCAEIGNPGQFITTPAFTASLDAILAHLLPEGEYWEVNMTDDGAAAVVSCGEWMPVSYGKTPAIALAIACIRARMEGE